MIKEFREFFIRTTKVFTGNKSDQELNYPIDNVVNTCNGKELKYNRLLSQHYASDDVIKKFLESITFKLNPEDTAKHTEQGLSLKANDYEAADNYIELSDFVRTLQSHQLPVMVDDMNILIPHKYYDLTNGNIYNNLALAIASGNKFTKALIGSSGVSGNKLLFGEAFNPAIIIANNPTVPIEQGKITIDKNLHLLVAGDILTYSFVYEIINSIGNETKFANVEVVLFDGVTEVTIYSNINTLATPKTEIPIRLQRTNVGDLFISTGNWAQTAYVNMPNTSTFEIYIKYSTDDIASVIKIEHYALICESKKQ